MRYTMTRFGGCEPITREVFRTLREKLLNARRSGMERGLAEGRLRHRRGVEDDGLSRDYFTSIDVDKEVEMFKISPKERN